MNAKIYTASHFQELISHLRGMFLETIDMIARTVQLYRNAFAGLWLAEQYGFLNLWGVACCLCIISTVGMAMLGKISPL